MGVSIFAVQCAKAVGARVIATTSSPEKAKILERLGADHIINYRENVNWGIKARELTGGEGVDLVVKVAGPKTMQQSVESVKLDGTISVVSFVRDEGEGLPTLLDTWTKLFTTKGLWVGSRAQMEEMCKVIEGNLDRLRPVVDPVFSPEQLKEAHKYVLSGNYQGEFGIEIA